MARTIEELARSPSPESWRLLCEALAALPEREGSERAAEIEPALAAWDDDLRATMCGMDWDDRFFAGNPDPRSAIVRFLRFDTCSASTRVRSRIIFIRRTVPSAPG